MSNNLSGITIGTPIPGTTTSSTTGYSTIIPYYPNTGVTYTSAYTLASSGFYCFVAKNKKMPKAMYVNGKRISVGIIGTNAQCFYMGNEKFVLDSTVNPGYCTRQNIIMEYKNETHTFSILSWNDATHTVDAELLSITK